MAYIGRQLVRGQNRVLDDISSSFNGSTTAFNLTVSSSSSPPASVNQLWIILGGVLQKPGTDFTVADAVLTFTTAPASTLSFWGMIQGDTSDINSPADASVTPSKIANSGDFAFPADVRFKDADGSHYVGLQAPSTVSSNLVWSLPAADGSSGQLLKTDGSGNLGWVSDTQSNLLDEDNMSSNSATQPASQQSIKAYADTKAVLTGSTNNQIVTVTGANAITGESDLTFDGNTLSHSVGANSHRIESIATGNYYTELRFDANRSAADDYIAYINFKWDGDSVADILCLAGADTTNKDDGYLVFRTSPSQGSIAERLRIASDAVITATQSNSAVGLIVKNTAHDSQLQILATAANKNSVIWFGDNDDGNKGWIDYDHNTDAMSFRVNAAERLSIDSSGNLSVYGGDGNTHSIRSESYCILELTADTNNDDGNTDVILRFKNYDTVKGEIRYDESDALLEFSNGTGNQNHLTIDTSGNVQIGAGNLKIGTAGKGIDFSTTSDSGGMASEILDDYEEGTWTLTDQSGAGLSLSVTGAVYTKIGRMVYARAHSIVFPTTSDTTGAHLGGLPFTCSNNHGSGGRPVTSDSDASAFLVDNNTTKFWVYGPTTTSGSTNAQLSGATIYGLLLVYEAS